MQYQRDNILAMVGYVSGEQPDDDNTIKLNTNENPYPPSPEIQRVLDDFHLDSLRRYPPPTADPFRQLAARLHHVTQENIIATRGGDELLRLLITTFVNPGEAIGMTNPTYSLYPVLAQIQGCPVTKIELNEDWTLAPDFAEKINAAGCKLTFLVNPHAPSGKLLAAEDIATLATNLNSILLVDEAYIDFVQDPYDLVPLIFKHDNLVILRTLSKGYSLAGLRFGYGIGPVELIKPMLEKTRDSYNLDLLSQKIAETALSNHQHAMSNCQEVIAERERLRKALIDMGFEVESSQTNFLLVSVNPGEESGHPPPADALYRQLKDRGILVRYFPEERLSNKLRVTVGTSRENDALLGTLNDLLS